MEILQVFGVVFLLIMAAGFIVALSGKEDRKKQRPGGQDQSRVVVTQRVPSASGRKNRRAGK